MGQFTIYCTSRPSRSYVDLPFRDVQEPYHTDPATVGKHASKSRVIQVPPGKHDLDRADRIGQGDIYPERSTS